MTTEINKRIGQQIAAIRKSKNKSRLQFCNDSGMHYANVSKIEYGRISATLDTLNRIAEALGCELKIEFEQKKL